MKKLIINLTLLIFVAYGLMNPLMAQKYPAGKHSNLLSGGLSLISAGGDLYEDNSKRLIQFQLNSSWAYFTTEGFGIGVQMIVSLQSQDDYSYTSIAFGPTIKYFISSDYQPAVIKGKVYPYVTASVLVSSISYKSNDGDGAYSSGYLYYLGGGVAVMLTNSVALNFEIGYQGESMDATTGNLIDFQIGIMAFL